MGAFNEFELSDEARKRLKDKKYIKKALQDGLTAQEIVGYSDNVMAKFYGAARKLFEGQRYTDAADAFLFLVTLNPRNHEYWLGLGMATQMCKNFEGAIDAYEMAALLEINNPVPYFYLAKCLFALHERESVISALELAIESADDNPDFQELRNQAKAALDLIRSDRNDSEDFF